MIIFGLHVQYSTHFGVYKAIFTRFRAQNTYHEVCYPSLPPWHPSARILLSHLEGQVTLQAPSADVGAKRANLRHYQIAMRIYLAGVPLVVETTAMLCTPHTTTLTTSYSRYLGCTEGPLFRRQDDVRRYVHTVLVLRTYARAFYAS